MKIDAIDEKSILVELSKEDLLKNEITYERLDYSNEETRRLVRSVLERIRLETGRIVSDINSLEVDVMPDSFGGCLMIFREKENAESERGEENEAFVTEEFNNLIDLARGLKKANIMIEKTELYRFEKTFFLFAEKVTPVQRAAVSEYLEPLSLSKMRVLSVKEACDCLLKSHALKTLSQ